MKPSKQLFSSQLLLLQKLIQNLGGSFIYVHKFLIDMKLNGINYLIKLNQYDREIFVINQVTNEIEYFTSFYDFMDWVKEKN